MKNKYLLFVIIIIAFMANIITLRAKEKISVGVSTFALYDISTHIAKDRFDVFMILPFGVSVHSFEPTPKLLVKLTKSDLVIYSGAGLEPWAGKFDFGKKALDMSLYVKLTKTSHKHHYHMYDPHYWLDISNMIKATKIITKKFIILSPKDREFFQKNEALYITMLKNLDTLYKQKLSICKQDTIILKHNAFSYLGKRYGFKTHSLSGLSDEEEPSIKKTISILKQIKKDGIDVVFFESFSNARMIKNIAKESGVRVDVLEPLANITADEAKQHLSYEDIMKQNLTKLQKALQCQ